jgi:hypothetical protein
MSELRKGLRVCIPGVNGINRGTVVEVARLTTGVGHHDDDSERNVVHGALVQLDDGRRVHRWQDEIVVGKQVLSPMAHVLWSAMRIGARRVPDGERNPRIYAAPGVLLVIDLQHKVSATGQ